LIALLQRVDEARVTVGGEVVGELGRGLLVLLGVVRGDGEREARRLAERVAAYRCLPDEASGRPMERSLLDLGLGALVVSQFTLCASTRKGLRPGFDAAAPPDEAERLYAVFCDALAAAGVAPVERGRFQAHMKVALVNDGPVTLWLEQAPPA